jgi:uncharacterized protein (TIGR00251 family)
MTIRVLVKTNAKKESVEVRDDGSLFVCVNVPPVEGKANQKVVELLSRYLGKPKRAITIIRGHRSKLKVVEVE